MGKRKQFVALTAAVTSALALSGAPSMAASGDCRVIRPATETAAEVSACRQDVFFHGASVLGNAAGTGQVQVPSWNTTAPTGDMPSRYVTVRPVDSFFARHLAARPTFAGTYTGVLDNLAIDLFISHPAYQTLGAPVALYNRLEIDGQVVWENAAGTDPEIAVPMSNVDDTTSTISYAFTDLYQALEELGIDNTSTTEHTIRFSVINKYVMDNNFVIHFDATPTPSGMSINLEPNSRGRLPKYTEIDTN